MPELTNDRHERFAKRVAGGVAASIAYVEVGFKAKNSKTAEACASRLLATAKVRERVAELRADLASAAQRASLLTREWVIDRLQENAERAMQARPVLNAEGNPTGEYRYEGNVANRALELLGKELGMFRERVEQVQPEESKLVNERLARVEAMVRAAFGSAALPIEPAVEQRPTVQ
ncbi:MAG: hypothetical protein AB7O45_02710 [Alphaproteobacteria bacterium]